MSKSISLRAWEYHIRGLGNFVLHTLPTTYAEGTREYNGHAYPRRWSSFVAEMLPVAHRETGNAMQQHPDDDDVVVFKEFEERRLAVHELELSVFANVD
jgi:hypothetical protein